MYINLKTIDLCPGQGGISKPEEHLIETITTNGSHTYSPTPGSVFSDATISVAVPMKVEETFTVNPSTVAQTVTPESGHVFSSGTVNAVDSTIDSNIQAANIKDGVTILGVLGTYTGGITPTGTISIPTNGTYDVTSYASAQVAVGGKDYRNQTGTIPGLADLGWDADSIGYANANIQHYSWENADYAVTQANKDLYGVVNRSNKNNYKNNPDMEYVPMFDTTGVSDMREYFDGFRHIKGLPILDTSSVTNMESMFYFCTSLTTIPLLDTSSVTYMGNMFRGCTSLKTVPALDTSSVRFMTTMFYECTSLTTIPILDTSSVTNMDSMFYFCTSLTSIPLLDTSKVTSMGSMLYNCNKLTTIPLLDTSKVTNMRYMLNNCSSLITIPTLDTSSVTNMEMMFYNCTSLTSIPALDTSSVTNMNQMFTNCSSLITVPALDTSSVTNMNQMFTNCSSLTAVNGIDFSSLTSAPSSFFGWSAGQTITRFIVNGKIDFTWNGNYGLDNLTNIDFDSVKSILQAMSRTTNTNAKTMKLNRTIADQNGELAALITDCQTKGWTITGLTIPTGDPVIHYTSKDGNIVTPYQLPSGLTVVSNVYQDGVGTITFNTYPTYLGDYMYRQKSQLDTIDIPDEVRSIGYMTFADGCGITKITIPSNVKSFSSNVFSSATNLVEVVMESAVPPSIGTYVFSNHNADLVIKVPASAVNAYKTAPYWSDWASLIVGYATLQDIGWDAQSISYYGNQVVTSANAALYGVVDKDNKGDYQDDTDMEYVPMFNTTGVTAMNNYFDGFSHIKGLPILDTSAVGDMEDMFSGCSSLTTIPLLDTSSVMYMYGMFTGCSSLTSIPLLNTSVVEDMNSMFSGCSSLTTVPALDTSSVTNFESMFDGCTSLTTVNGIDFSSMTVAPSQFMYNAGSTVTHFIVNGKIDFTWNGTDGLNNLTAIDFDSVKSILQAMSRTTDTNAKTMKLSMTIRDQNGQLAALKTQCESKGWTITGLTINSGGLVVSDDDEIIIPGDDIDTVGGDEGDFYYETGNQATVNGLQMYELHLKSDDTLVGYIYYDENDGNMYYYDTNGNQLNTGDDSMFLFDDYLVENGLAG